MNSNLTMTCMHRDQMSYCLMVNRNDAAIYIVMKNPCPDNMVMIRNRLMMIDMETIQMKVLVQQNVTEKLQRIWTWKTIIAKQHTQTLWLWVLSQMSFVLTIEKKKIQKKNLLFS